MAELNEVQEDVLADVVLLESNRKARLKEVAKDSGQRADLIVIFIFVLLILVLGIIMIATGSHDRVLLGMAGLVGLGAVVGIRTNHLRKRVDALVELLDDAEKRNDNKDGDQELVP